MRVLSAAESAEWLEERDLPADPYSQDDAEFSCYLQFYPPKHFRGVEAFVNAFLCAAGGEDSMLVSVTDTEMPWDFELQHFEKLRPAGAVPLDEAPYHLFDGSEAGEVVSMFSLTVGFQWKAYLHIPSTRSILYNWEGEIFDFWTDDPDVHEQVCSLLEGFKLQMTGEPPTEF